MRNRSTIEIEVTTAMAAQPAVDGRRWIKLMPAGGFTARDGRGPYRVTNPAAVIERTRAHRGESKMLVDYDHQSVFAAVKGVGGTAKAAGWIVDLEARPDGIYGAVEWTRAAAEHIAQGEYRYLSSLFAHRKNGTVLRLENAALTNSPALDGLEAALNTRMDMDNNLKPETIAQAAAILNLDPESDRDEIAEALSAFSELLGRPISPQEPDPAKYVPMATFQATAAELSKLRQGVTQETAERHVTEAIKGGQLMPFMRDWAVSLCTVNKPAFDDFIGGIGPAVSEIVTPLSASRHPGTATSRLSDTENAVCRNLGLTEEEFAKARDVGATE